VTNALLIVGTLQLASAALLGWLIALQRSSPEKVKALGIVAPRRIMQLHLDQVMMGVIDIAVASAFPALPAGIALALVIGTIFNPLGFVPLAFVPALEQGLPYRVFIVTSFVFSTIGFVGLAVWVCAFR
jgi:hypothetical protein